MEGFVPKKKKLVMRCVWFYLSDVTNTEGLLLNFSRRFFLFLVSIPANLRD